MNGTFSQRVYKVVASIPCGETRSYRWVAQKAGRMKAFRAVGQILKRNPHPLTVPCHRVVKSDHSLGGYAWGERMKRELLRLEVEQVESERTNLPRIVSLPLDKKAIAHLKAGDEILLNGVLYTARDAAHKRMVAAIENGKRTPISLRNQIIYYCGPTPAKRGGIIGSCGPTTSSRMDQFTVPLLKKGLTGMIGKGRRSEEIRRAIKRYQAVYFLAPGGIGALSSRYVKEAKVVGYRELGPEAIYRLKVERFPVIVGIDIEGGSVYD